MSLLLNSLNKDTQLLESAYQAIIEKKSCKCESAKTGCDCDDCENCKSNQKEAKKLSPKQKALAKKAPPTNKITGADFAAKNVKESFEEAYNEIFAKFN
jgi:hypothetical protein